MPLHSVGFEASQDYAKRKRIERFKQSRVGGESALASIHDPNVNELVKVSALNKLDSIKQRYKGKVIDAVLKGYVSGR